MAIHFHSNQLSAIFELVSSTLGMKVPIRHNNLTRMKQIFTQEIFTEQVGGMWCEAVCLEARCLEARWPHIGDFDFWLLYESLSYSCQRKEPIGGGWVAGATQRLFHGDITCLSLCFTSGCDFSRCKSTGHCQLERQHHRLPSDPLHPPTPQE